MTREQLEHVIRASASIAADDELVIVGSQAILATYPGAPASLLRSVEADVYPLHHPERADLIDGSIGEGSPFHRTFGYYAQGVGPRTAVLPGGWRERLVAVRGPGTQGATGWALEVHDLVTAKLVAGRDKDREFVIEVLRHHLARPDVLRERVAGTELPADLRGAVEARLAGWISAAAR